jgi:hypothetical protein
MQNKGVRTLAEVYSAITKGRLIYNQGIHVNVQAPCAAHMNSWFYFCTLIKDQLLNYGRKYL